MSGQQPRQRRAIETRRRLYEAALDEFERVGVSSARVEDIVTSAGVGWGTFFRYFPRKEDVLIEAGAEMAAVFAIFIQDGMRRGDPVVDLATGGLARAATATLTGRPGLRLAVSQEIAAHPERLAAHLAELERPTMVDTLTELLQVGQDRGEVRTDLPAREMAEIIMASVSTAQRQELSRTRPAGSRHRVLLAVELLAQGFVPRD